MDEQNKETISGSVQNGQSGSMGEMSKDQPPAALPGRIQFAQKFTRKKMLITASSVIGVFLLSGVVLAYFYYFQSPDEILRESMAKLFSAETAEFAIDISPAESALGTISISETGIIDKKDLSNIKTALTVKIGITLAGENKENFFGEVDIRKIAGDTYLKFVKLEIPGGGVESDILKGQWIKLESDSLSSFEGMFFSGYGSEEMEGKNNDILPISNISDEKRDKISKLIIATDAVKVVKKLPDENIEGVRCYHFMFEIDKSKAEQLFLDVLKIIAGRDLTAAEIEKSNKIVDSYVADNANQFQKNEIWIGKKEKMPFKIILNYKNPLLNMLANAKEKAKFASFQATAVSANPKAMTCADESVLNTAKAGVGSAICNDPNVTSVTWPELTSGVCDNDSYSVSASDSGAADGTYNYSASCSISGSNVSVECSENGCLTKPESSDFNPSNQYSILALLLKNFNKTVQIEAPESAKSMEEILTGPGNEYSAPNGANNEFWSVVASANPPAVTCADEASIIAGAAGQPICKNKSVVGENWPAVAADLCANSVKYVVYDAKDADGIYAYAASCHYTKGDINILVVCSQDGCGFSGEESTDSDSDNLSDHLESIFGTDPKNPDTDGDSYKDGDELIKGYNPLIRGE